MLCICGGLGLSGTPETRGLRCQARLQNFLMSRANSIDFLDSSGWPGLWLSKSSEQTCRPRLTHEKVLMHLYPPDGPGRLERLHCHERIPGAV